MHACVRVVMCVYVSQCFADKVVEESASDSDFVWIHDYHLLVLPSLLRKRFNRIRTGIFLHSPFPSSEIFRTFPKREELLRSLLNADLIGGAGCVHAPAAHTVQAHEHRRRAGSGLFAVAHHVRKQQRSWVCN